jgi:hypothetical protein
MSEQSIVVEHPNRAKSSSRATKAVVILLLLVSVVLLLLVTIGGWDVLEGAKGVQVFFIAVYLLIAFYVARWNRGVLPVAAALAIIMLIFAAVAVPGWFDRDASGFRSTALSASVLGLICAILVPVQALLIAFAMRAFQQAWNVEVERGIDATGRELRASA